MNIAIDAREAKPSAAGKGRYVAELIRALSLIDKTNQYFLLSHSPIGLTLSQNFHHITLAKMPYLSLAGQLKKHKIDIFLSPTSFLMAIAAFAPTVIVVHDLAVFIERRANPTFKTMFLEKISLPIALKRARQVITVSHNTKTDLKKLFKVADEKVKVVWSAAFPNDRKGTDAAAVMRKYNLPKRYILYVGTLEPRKNIDGLIHSYALLPASLREKVPLVLVGKRGWSTALIDEAIEATNMKSYVKELGFVEDADLPALYRSAAVFAYPSWYEGFGFPVLEAMSYGVPVVSSNTSCLPEVAGNAAVLVSPGDTKGLMGAIEKVLTDISFASRLKNLSLKRAKEFSWEKTAKQTLDLLLENGRD